MTLSSFSLVLVLGQALAAGPSLTLKLEDDTVAPGDPVFALARLDGGETVVTAVAEWLDEKIVLHPEPGGRVPVIVALPLTARERLILRVTVVPAGSAAVAATAEVRVKAAAGDDESTRHPGTPAEAEPDELARAIRAAAGPRRFAGDFDPPLDARVVGFFAERRARSFGSTSGEYAPVHRGIDLAARAGSAVRTPQAGRILAALSLPDLGETVLVDHGLGIVSLLAHLDAAAVRAGDHVGRHSVIGWSGASGAVEGPLLHYEVLVSGVPVNPRRLEKLPRWLDGPLPSDAGRTGASAGTAPPAQRQARPTPTPAPTPSPEVAPAAATPVPTAVPPEILAPVAVTTPPVGADLTLADLVMLLARGVEARLPGARAAVGTSTSPSAKSSERDPPIDLTVGLSQLGRLPFYTAVETTAFVAGELTTSAGAKTGRLTVTNQETGQSVTLLTRDARQLWRERTGLATPIPRNGDH